MNETDENKLTVNMVCETQEQSGQKTLTPEAQRALAEAEERRKTAIENQASQPKEIGGRKQGLDPARYGDWERGGLICDF